MIEQHENRKPTGRHEDRRQWVSPQISRMKATDAESGANPVNPEGLGFGS